MKSIKALLAATVALAGLTAAISADATVLTYNVNGTFTNGAVLSGSFSFDTAGATFSQYSNVNLSMSGVGTFNSISGLGYSGSNTGTTSYNLSASSSALPGKSIALYLTGTHTGFVLNAIASTALGTSTYYYNGSNLTYLTGGTVTAAVPETATWGMMIAGFGLMGGAMRYRRRSTGLAYA